MDARLQHLGQRLRIAVGFAWQSIRTNRRRIALAVAGVAIGIAAVTSMLVIGDSVTAQATRALDQLGADVVTISVQPPGADPSDQSIEPLSEAAQARMDATTEAAAAALRHMPEVQSVARLERRFGCANGPETALGSPDIVAAHPDLPGVLSLRLQRGRFLSPLDARQPWIVLGADVAAELRKTRLDVRPGTALTLCGKTFFLAGVLAPYIGDDLLQSVRMNHAVFVSYASLRRLTGPPAPAPSFLLTRLQTGATAPDMPGLLGARLRTVLSQTVEASGAKQVSELRQQQVSLYTRFLAVLGCVALLVGSLGITNVMLASVSERKTEIGLRMALGAHTTDVVAQFLTESVLICLLGAALGLVLGIVSAAVALTVAQIGITLNIATPLCAALLALLSGLAAGAYPAANAARLDPVTLLQGRG
ncbi:ABC transporter permease [Ralstonia solanacearum]|uniref:ABC transporter permease n=1 Tax=Ralstonia solanacearum TaxID=305 RepID=UPI0005C6512F|nr:ABC transporter permease [Ralstonia solanacearum]MBB6593527.1 ABC transporter permease [Ralstonia solanacearum]MBB6597754.1 ABC transporter permease [Ralstonia solanacearum]MDB0544043.1 ABC transporter permease [Ralstonia solanacearum]MDB0553814.1 ABC transporter permease [Ralstonia solanacearum]MDB0558914.1 ABC transporter permease [Ralstonia solanacearum]